MGRTTARLRLAGGLLALALLAAACSSAGATTGGSSGGLSIRIASPADGATVTEPFTVKLDASVPIGDPSTGDNHVHLCFDGGSCDELSQSVIAYSDSVQVTDLTPGTHTIEASLRNADHSDTGQSTQITVTVSGSGSGAGSQSGAGTGTGSPTGNGTGGGYGY